MDVRSRSVDGRPILDVTGEVDLSTSTELRTAILERVGPNQPSLAVNLQPGNAYHSSRVPRVGHFCLDDKGSCSLVSGGLTREHLPGSAHNEVNAPYFPAQLHIPLHTYVREDDDDACFRTSLSHVAASGLNGIEDGDSSLNRISSLRFCETDDGHPMVAHLLDDIRFGEERLGPTQDHVSRKERKICLGHALAQGI